VCAGWLANNTNRVREFVQAAIDANPSASALPQPNV
jgi:hypothetical protein